MYALFFHRLSILERATDHKCIKECSHSKRNVGRPCEFFLREEVSPRSIGGAVGGGGLASQVLPGDFEQGRGDLWQASRELKWLVFLASKFGGLFSRVNLAGFHSKIFWRVILAHLFGGSYRHIYLAGFHKQ